MRFQNGKKIQCASGSVFGRAGSICSIEILETLASGPKVTTKLLRFRKPVNVNSASQGVPDARIRRSRSFENCLRVVQVRVGLSSGNVEEVVLTDDPAGLVIAMKRSCPFFDASPRRVQEIQPEPESITSAALIPE